MQGILANLVFALALCADCFAVSVCSSVTLKRVEIKNVTAIALTFALVQAGLLMAGWFAGELCAGLLGRMATLVAFALLMYVGMEMIVSSLRPSCDIRDLNGMHHIFLGALATSMDALAAGASMSLAGEGLSSMLGRFIAVLVITALSVLLGIVCGHRIGHRFGKWVEAVGGTILILIGVRILL